MIKEGYSPLPADKQQLALMLKALGNPTRFRIMETLSVEHVQETHEIVQDAQLAQSTVSQHLKVLAEAGLIQSESAGPATRYSINQEGVRWLKRQVSHWLPERTLTDE
jgi:ArsR family transcriptional regulator, arsenate/arsenite/antimonite-responsive transcriptional repressor